VPRAFELINQRYGEVLERNTARSIWGNEKVLSTTTQRVGAATQRFVVEVQ